jgi:LPPG:FO 2-phospho-L-lactate transferase
VVAVLAGGTGGAKLARGLLDVVGAEELRVIANTGDDIEVYGVHVSPDPDLVTFWLADVIDDRGFGLRGDTWEVMTALERAGHDPWFRLGDRDLALCLIRSERLRGGARLTEAQAGVAKAIGVSARVLPMSDDPVRTHVVSGGRAYPFQEFMVVHRAEPPIEGVELQGIEHARPTPDVLEAVAGAEAIVVGPSNPVISIGPILAVPGLSDAIAQARAPVVAVSPFVSGRAVKGPTEAFCTHTGIAPTAEGVAAAYGDVLEGMVADEPVASIPSTQIDTRLDEPGHRRTVAETTLDLARRLAGD